MADIVGGGDFRYRIVENWAKLPEGRVWGQAIGVDIDRDSTSVWVYDRCGAKTCEGSNIAPIAAEAARIDEALEATKNADFDLAILDANLNGQPVSPVADALVARGTPFVFATGYGEPPESYRDRPTLKKPFQMDGLKQMLQSALDRGSQ